MFKKKDVEKIIMHILLCSINILPKIMSFMRYRWEDTVELDRMQMAV